MGRVLVVRGQSSVLGRDSDSWISYNGATNHMTSTKHGLYNLRPPSPMNAIFYDGDGIPLAAEYVGSLNLTFHGKQDALVTLESVSFVTAMPVNLLSLHTVQANDTQPPSMQQVPICWVGAERSLWTEQTPDEKKRTSPPRPIIIYLARRR